MLAAALLRGSAAVLLPMLYFLVFVIRHQRAKIRCHQPRLSPAPDADSAGRGRSAATLAMKKTPLDPGDGIGQNSAFLLPLPFGSVFALRRAPGRDRRG